MSLGLRSAIGVPRGLVRFGAPLLLVVLALPLVRAQVFSTNDAFDEVNYHRPIIATMAAEFPAVDIVNYNAAMAPGYHVAMARVLRATGSWAAVRAANLAIGVLLVVLAGHVAWQLSGAMERRADHADAGGVVLCRQRLGVAHHRQPGPVARDGFAEPACSSARPRRRDRWRAESLARWRRWSGRFTSGRRRRSP